MDGVRSHTAVAHEARAGAGGSAGAVDDRLFASPRSTRRRLEEGRKPAWSIRGSTPRQAVGLATRSDPDGRGWVADYRSRLASDCRETMSDNTNDSFELSRRKALAGLGGIGTATALGGIGTYAQFTDTEDATMTFSAGGIDGTLSWGATYNSSGNTLDADEIVQQPTVQQNGVGLSLELDDVKPGDYGSIVFGIEVQNNPAWVASCLGIESDTDHIDYEPEVEADDDVSSANVDEDGSFDAQSSNPSSDPGEVAENLFIIPFYTEENPDSGDDPLEATFFDAGWPNSDYNPDGDLTFNLTGDGLSPSAVGTNAGFWNSREGSNNFASLNALSLENAVQQPIEPSTVGWGKGVGGSNVTPEFFTEHVAPDAVAEGIGEGCVFVDGALADSDNEDGGTAGALQAGDTVYFGYDWHIPFSVGNEMQGDKLVWNIGFTFSQIRHTESAQMSNIFAPGQNSPEDIES